MNTIETAKALFFKGLDFLEKQDFANAENLFIDTLELAPRSIPALNNLAIAQYEQKKIREASITVKKAIEIDPRNIDAYLMLSACQKEQEKYEEALSTFETIIGIDPTIAQAHCNRGYVLNKVKNYQEAIISFDRALAIQPEFSDAYLNRGNSLQNLKRFDEAFAAYDKALTLKPDLAEAWHGRGNVFTELKRYDEAFAAYDRALALKPDLADAWLGRGNVFTALKRYDEAFAAYDKALTFKPDLADAWLGRGNVFTELKRFDEAFAAYDKALTLKPDLAEAWHGRGNVFTELKRYDEAFAAYDRALALKPDLADAWLGRGNVFTALKRYDEAFAAYDKALAFKPDLADAWLGRGNVFTELKRFDEAFAAYDKVFSLKPALVGVEGARLHAKMHLCDWSNFDAECDHLIASVKAGKGGASPFTFLAIPSSAADQHHQCAKLWIAEKYPPSQKPTWRGERYRHDRIRVAYVSADVGEHPVFSLAVGMFEHHDKSRFDVTALSLGPNDNSKMFQRLKASFERFIDAKTYSDDQVANLVASSEVDILVDLMGFTGGSRTGIFARRVAPIQVNYLGYLGTMGAEYIDYIIADHIVIPETQYDSYAEKIVYLPNSFQPTDHQRPISDKRFTRAEVGLPQEGFVFCCFNTNYKITPDVYDIWMRILKQVPDSVLWLVAEGPTVERNLKNEAAARGVSGERLIFAQRMPLPEHQARVQLAGLFLDTWPYNAGATASDMLWSGLPVMTRIGDTFVGRMAASLLNAIHLPELIATTPEAYEQMAVDLATHPEKLAAVKHKLAENRLTTPLFDTKLFTKHIEAAYSAMFERYQARLPPDQIAISD